MHLRHVPPSCFIFSDSNMVSIIQRLTVASLLCILVLTVVKESSGNPGQEQHDVNSVADAIRYLQDLENRHQFARPRYHKLASIFLINFFIICRLQFIFISFHSTMLFISNLFFHHRIFRFHLLKNLSVHLELMKHCTAWINVFL